MKTVDTRGLSCPEPVLLVKKAISEASILSSYSSMMRRPMKTSVDSPITTAIHSRSLKRTANISLRSPSKRVAGDKVAGGFSPLPSRRPHHAKQERKRHTMEYVATFHTHYGALSFLKRLRDLGDEKAMMDSRPRKLSVLMRFCRLLHLCFWTKTPWPTTIRKASTAVEGDDYIEIFANH